MDGRILIIDDVATNRIVFKVKLGAASYHPLMAAGGVEGLRIARQERPDLILLDLMLPDLPGVEVLRQLRDDAATRDIPVIVVSSSSLLEDRMAALEAGADDVFVKPYDDQLLMARLRNLLRTRQDLAELAGGDDPVLFGMAEEAADFIPSGTIALVTDRHETAMRLRRNLAPQLRDRIISLARNEALADPGPDRSGADLYLIDAEGSQAERALRLVSDLRSRTATRNAGIVLMTSPGNQGTGAQADAMMAFDLGANAVVSAEMTPAEIAERLRAVLRRKSRADQRRARVQDGLRLAMIDPLTGLHNRRYATARLTAIADQAMQQDCGFGLMIADIDRFKSVNDSHGHSAGDQVLVEVASRLAASLREGDLLARIGGEEFLIALPSIGLSEAKTIAERLCTVIEQRPIDLGDDRLSITISIGLAHSGHGTGRRPLHSVTADQIVDGVMDDADRALLASKNEGRNKVTLGRSAA